MRNYFALVFLLFIAGFTAVLADPVISLTPVSSSVICSTGNDTLLYAVTASGLPANTNVVIYQSSDSLFNPYNGEGDSIGYIPGNAIPQDTFNFSSCVKILGILIDACGAVGLEQRNEYIILTSGNGIKVSNLAIDFSSQNNSGSANADINLGATPCGYKIPSPTLIASLQNGSCNSSNLFAAGPGDSIPADAVIIVFTSDSVDASYNINGLCNLNRPVYILQSSCLRTIGAFTNASNCGVSRYRTTTATDKNQNCSSDFTYDLCSIFNKDGTYAIRQPGLDTASVGNNGIRRNLVDSCGGLDYSQFNFTADTILKFRIPLAYCNTGYHYLKAITNPYATQPLSNAIDFKLVCNDVDAIGSTTICSSNATNITISSIDPNASFSWTVSGGTLISGASSGSGNQIAQLLTYSGDTKDSVTYTIISSDAGCTATKQITVVVNNCACSTVITGNTAFCQGDSIVLDAGAGFSFYTWSNGENTQTITVKQPGRYEVTVIGQNECVAKDSVDVEVSPLPEFYIIPGNLFCPGGQTTLSIPSGFSSVLWSSSETSDSIIVSNEGSYSVSAQSTDGCPVSAAIDVLYASCGDKDLWIPNAFSPNGDGINDVFMVRGNPSTVTIEKMVIYNRLGNKVFESNNGLPNDTAAGWDGQYKGQLAQVDSYAYYVLVKLANGIKKEIKGSLTLIQ